jgi:hypothetical protein
MSVKVDLAELAETAAGYATVPMLLTTDEDGRPRASVVSLDWDGKDVVAGAGRRSVANAAVRPLVSLLWPAAPDQDHALLVDGEATSAEDGAIRIRPDGAILHVVDRTAPHDPSRPRHC